MQAGSHYSDWWNELDAQSHHRLGHSLQLEHLRSTVGVGYNYIYGFVSEI